MALTVYVFWHRPGCQSGLYTHGCYVNIVYCINKKYNVCEDSVSVINNIEKFCDKLLLMEASY